MKIPVSPARVAVLSAAILLLILELGCSTTKHVLIYTKNGKGYVHENIAASAACIKDICGKNGWVSDTTDDPAVFTNDNLKKYNLLVLANTNNDIFDTESQRSALQQFIHNGGGFLAIHSACGSERKWPWFWANLGGKFVRHAKVDQELPLKVIDPTHPATQFLPPVWLWHPDECYYLNNLNPDIHVLLAVDLTKIADDKKEQYPGVVFGDYFPLCWCHEFEGGRQFYTAIGHFPKDYQDENFVKHLTGGMRWAMRLK